VTTKLLPAIVSVAVRDCVVEFAAAVIPTLPEPVRPAPFEIVTHAEPPVALQLQLAPVVTFTVVLPPAAANDWLVGESVNEQGVPACVTVKVLVPIVTVPVRDAVPLFDATLSVTEPDPTPLAPVVTVIHVALLTAVHAHVAALLTVTVSEPAVLASDWLAGEMVGGHGKLNENVFERGPAAVPPGPAALTTAS
jgi:hypothetical protein